MSRHHHRHNRVQGRRWDRLRRFVLRRDGYRCRTCGKAGRLEVDHVKPLHLGGARFDPANCRTLCRSCHIAKTRSENRAHPEPPGAGAWRAFVAELP